MQQLHLLSSMLKGGGNRASLQVSTHVAQITTSHKLMKM